MPIQILLVAFSYDVHLAYEMNVSLICAVQIQEKAPGGENSIQNMILDDEPYLHLHGIKDGQSVRFWITDNFRIIHQRGESCGAVLHEKLEYVNGIPLRLQATDTRNV